VTLQPKVKQGRIELVDVDGGRTVIELTGDNLEGLLTEPKHVAVESGYLMRPPRMQWVGGSLSIMGVETSTAQYYAPERPKPRFEVGQKVKLSANITPAGFPHRAHGWVGEVTKVYWAKYQGAWQYDLKDRDDKSGLTLTEDPSLDGAVTVVEDWPFRKGDFVTYHPKLEMGSDDVYKLVRRTTSEDVDAEMPAWWLANEEGLTGTYLRDDKMVRVNGVTVTKTESWVRG
jgi:hypothetical protein